MLFRFRRIYRQNRFYLYQDGGVALIISDSLISFGKDDTSRTTSRELFAKIYEQYYKRVYNFCFYRTNDHYAAEDISGNIFERVITKYHLFDENKSPFEAWLFMLAHNAVADYYRRKKPTVRLDELSHMPDERHKTPDLRIADKEINLLLAQTVAILKQKERAIVALKYGAGLKNTEIARVLKMTESNTGVLLYRTLKKLHKHLLSKGVDLNE
jgi:RNA polymerase sigma-70 factor (ECF subfamily)